MKRRFAFFASALLLAGCGGDAGPGPEEHEHGGESVFSEGKGLRLAEETRQALGLKTAEVSLRPIEPVLHFTAQVYEASEGASARATATVEESVRPGERVSFLLDGKTRAGAVEAVEAAPFGKSEVLLALADPERKLTVGAFVPISVRRPGIDAPAIPRSAVLETATGKFAFVQNGDFLLRTPIQTGREGGDAVEITDGLYEGDVVAAQPVETLHLIELRATKGGGHSH